MHCNYWNLVAPQALRSEEVPCGICEECRVAAEMDHYALERWLEVRGRDYPEPSELGVDDNAQPLDRMGTLYSVLDK